ncbi:MAG TPA: SH3 domain-containing protein [Kiloniellales bacterium]|nr:SH3 domain-containing protein [Kiloniellales bacterium]
MVILLGLVWSASAARAADPAYFEVQGLKADEALTLRASASNQSEAVGQLPNGTLLRNLGCQEHKGTKWCNVQPADDAVVRGWVEHRYLREANAPASQPLGDASDEQATGEAQCKLKAHPDVTSCFYVATRYSGGSATVVLTYAGGMKRVLEYQNRKFHPQVGDETVATEKKGDQFVISVNHGAEVFHLPATAVLGGGD